MAVALRDLEVRTYIAEPERGERNCNGKAVEKEAVYANRRRVRDERGKRLQRGRGEKIERNFAHQFDTGGMDRLWVRGLANVHKRLLIQAAACNLALLMRSIYGVGKPKAAHDGLRQAVFAILGFIRAVEAFCPGSIRTCPQTAATWSNLVTSHNGSEQRSDTCGRRHGQCAPERDTHRAHCHASSARARSQPAQKGEERQ